MLARLRALRHRVWLRFIHRHVWGEWIGPIPVLAERPWGEESFTVERRMCAGCDAKEVRRGTQV